MPEISEARPASTVVLLRDGSQGLETLLLKRNKALMFAGGFWVFPGGSLDPADLQAADGDVEQAARVAAAREAYEEAGLRPNTDDMVQLSHWTTPEVEPRRFSTWIFAAPLESDEEVVIDGGEIHEARWIVVSQALVEHEAGELGMLPPTYVTLARLSEYATVAQMVASERQSPVPEVMPMLSLGKKLSIAMFRGDAGYDSGDPTVEGARHRAELRDGHWIYQYSDVDREYPALMKIV
jgi:8-oxo-dGTP pyrophosphatase MutT (NUDIX family)